MHLHSALDIDGGVSNKVLRYAYLNAFYETGFVNPIDEAIRTYRQFDLTSYQKLNQTTRHWDTQAASGVITAGVV